MRKNEKLIKLLTEKDKLVEESNILYKKITELLEEHGNIRDKLGVIYEELYDITNKLNIIIGDSQCSSVKNPYGVCIYDDYDFFNKDCLFCHNSYNKEVSDE